MLFDILFLINRFFKVSIVLNTLIKLIYLLFIIIHFELLIIFMLKVFLIISINKKLNIAK